MSMRVSLSAFSTWLVSFVTGAHQAKRVPRGVPCCGSALASDRGSLQPPAASRCAVYPAKRGLVPRCARLPLLVLVRCSSAARPLLVHGAPASHDSSSSWNLVCESRRGHQRGERLVGGYSACRPALVHRVRVGLNGAQRQARQGRG